MNKNKATHKGTCQCCGSVQKLPNGVLAKHGYTTRWTGWFSGTCQGSDWLPFEQSHTLISERFIPQAKASRQGIATKIAELRAGTHNLAMVRHQDPRTLKSTQAFVERSTVAIDGLYYTYELGGKQFKQRHLSASRDLNDILEQLDRSYVAHLDKQDKELGEYITWQEQRVANWQPGTLVEI